MATRWIVPAFDVAEDRHPGLGLRSKPSPCEQLAFQGCEEALAHGVIVRIADGSHGRSYAGLATTAAEGQSRILGGFKWSSQQDLLAYRSTRQTDPAFAHREARDLAS